MIPLTDDERVSMSISFLITYAELLNNLKQEVKQLKSEE